MEDRQDSWFKSIDSHKMEDIITHMAFETGYLGIGHSCDYSVYVWHYYRKLVYRRSCRKGHNSSKAHASGRIDPVKKEGSIAFSLGVTISLQKHIINTLIEAFPGVSFFVFPCYASNGVRLSEYYEHL